MRMWALIWATPRTTARSEGVPISVATIKFSKFLWFELENHSLPCKQNGHYHGTSRTSGQLPRGGRHRSRLRQPDSALAVRILVLDDEHPQAQAGEPIVRKHI